MDDEKRVHEESLEAGEEVYNSSGRLLGRITSFTDAGFKIETVEPGESDLEELPGQKFGEGYLMWRCGECGEMGELEDGMPETCPACGAPEEAISAMRED